MYEFSPQHTGTWFVIEFLRQHPQIATVILYPSQLPTRCTIEEWLVDHHKVCLEDQKVLLHAHTRKDFPSFLDDFHVLEGKAPQNPIVPLRDPLRSIITRQIRHPDKIHKHIVDGFLEVTKMKDAFFLPVDLPKSTDERTEALRGMCRHVGIRNDCNYIDIIAEQWTPTNTTNTDWTKVEYEHLKTNFNQKRFKKLVNTFSETYEYLKEHQSTLQPFLEKLGYKSLIWYEAVL